LLNYVNLNLRFKLLFEILSFQASTAAQRVFTAPVHSILDKCHCQNASHCFLHFTDETSSAYQSHLFLTNLSAVDLPQTTIKVICWPLSHAFVSVSLMDILNDVMTAAFLTLVYRVFVLGGKMISAM
jgi:hypothetical protein